MTVGAGAKKRTVPIHVVVSQLSSELCQVLPAMHHLTGSDYTSKVGRGKNQELKAKPDQYLLNFASGI